MSDSTRWSDPAGRSRDDEVVGIADGTTLHTFHDIGLKMQAAKDELLRTLTVMPDGTRFMIIFFDHETRT